MTKDEIIKALRDMARYPTVTLPRDSEALKVAADLLAQSDQEPVAFPRQAGDSTWTVDTAFIWRVKHTIDPDTPHDFIPSEEQIETVLLALERIPSGIYPTPPQRTWAGLPESAFAGMTLQQVTAMKYAEQILKDQNT